MCCRMSGQEKIDCCVAYQKSGIAMSWPAHNEHVLAVLGTLQHNRFYRRSIPVRGASSYLLDRKIP